MHTKYYIIAFAIQSLMVISTGTTAQIFHEAPVIPQDSLTVALYHSFITKLDSADILIQNGDYREAVQLYATSFEELKKYSEQRREHDARYLAEHYETEEKEQRIAFLNDTLLLKQGQNLLLVLLSIITIIILVLLFKFQKYRLRKIRLSAVQLEDETRLMELESEQHQLEARLQTLQTEKYQKELLAESLLVNHKNKVLGDLRQFIINNPELNTYRTELETILSTESVQAATPMFNTTVDEVHPVFYDKLQEQAQGRLTALDLEYSRMIYMKMTSKEMAEILQVDPSTIRMGKYRLKQKLGISKQEDLNGFIEQLVTM